MIDLAKYEIAQSESTSVFSDLIDVVGEPDTPNRLATRRALCQASGFLTEDRSSDGCEGFGPDIGHSIARIHRTLPDGTPNFATGILIGSGLLLTTQTTLPSRESTENAQATFRHEYDVDGTQRRPVHFQINSSVFLASSEIGYAVASVASKSLCGRDLGNFGFAKILGRSGKATKHEPTHLIQHRNGEPKSLSMRRNTVIGVHGPHLYTKCNGAVGSDGAAVLNTDWQLAAIQDGVVFDSTDLTKIIGNRGIRISAIVADLERQRESGSEDAKAVLEEIDTPCKHPIPSVQPEPTH